IAYAPLPWLGMRWMTLQWFALASLAMLSCGWLALVIIIAGNSAWYAILANPASPPATMVGLFVYLGAIQLLGVVGLYGGARLVRLHDELRAARGDLADLAIARERLRISRDLHDLLGQSLTAVSLKGDLAIGLLERGDTPRA